MADQDKPHPLRLALFSLPSAPLLALALPISIFLPPYYASHLGLPLAVVSAVFVGARIFDLLIDPLLGGVQDRTISRLGRRKLWIVASAPFLMALVWFAFIGIPAGAPALIATAGILALYFCYASMMIAHLSWAGELYPTYHGRTAALGALQIAGLVGQIAMLGLAAYVVASGLGDDDDAVHAMGWIIFAAIPLCVLICVLTTREKDAPPQPHLTIRDAIRALVTNPPLRSVLVPDVLTGVSQGVQSGLFLFFFQHVLLFWRESQMLLFVYFVAGLVGAPLWIWLGNKIGKHRALMIACLCTAATAAVLPFLPKGNLPVVAALMFVGGLPTAAAGLLLRAMMADVVDEDEVKTSARRTGLFFGLLLTTNKLGLAAGPMTYAVLGIAGFVATRGAANSEEAIFALTSLFVGLPIILNLLATWTLRSYDLDEARQAALRAEIDARAI
ncbi:MAG: MFS transporter [Caulobacterales bacterium]